jgi:D-alanyl-D-alanine carboxypeptidase
VSNSANRPDQPRRQPGKSGKTKPPPKAVNKLTAESFEDLPEAVRETPPIAPPRRKIAVWQGLALGLTGLILITTIVQLLTTNSSKNVQKPTLPIAPSPNTVLGHYPYTESPEAELEAINADGGIRLRKSAAAAYRSMVSEAAAADISLVPLSAFRSIKDQEGVFFDVKQQRSQTADERANVSAPPGYSEHHTGYAIDIGDGNVPATNLSPDFENTDAFKWLQANATKFNFEMSFSKNNKQGVTYEPWHWRYVGDRESLETFFKAKNN